jgi:hypothetical protein
MTYGKAIMKILNNDKGVALITSLMFTTLSLVICMSLLYMVTSSIKVSGAIKRYKTVMDATYGGTEIMTKDLMVKALSYGSGSAGTFSDNISGQMGGLNPTFSDCFQVRLENSKKNWSAACANVNGNPKSSPDVTFSLTPATGSPYTVYSKIVDTSDWRFVSFSSPAGGGVPVLLNKGTPGNSDRGGGDAGITKGGTVTQKKPDIPHYPYMYRIEVQGERQQNSDEKATISVQYAY